MIYSLSLIDAFESFQTDVTTGKITSRITSSALIQAKEVVTLIVKSLKFQGCRTSAQ